MRGLVVVALLAALSGQDPLAPVAAPPAGITGIVVDAEGAPAAGVRIHTRVYPWLEVWLPDHEGEYDFLVGPVAETDKAGGFSIPAEAGETLELRIESSESRTVLVRPCSAGDHVRIELGGSAAIEALALGPDGGAVAGAEVLVSGTRRGVVQHYATGWTGKDGRGRIEGLAPGLYSVGIRAPGLFEPSPATAWAPANGSTSVGLAFRPSIILRGIVLNADRGLPVAGARVSLDPQFATTVRSGDDGQFEIEAGESPALHLQVKAPGFATASAVVKPGNPVEVRLHRGDEVTGRVFSPEGKPVAGARVAAAAARIDQDAGQIYFDLVRTLSDEEGRFRLEDIRTGAPHTLVVMARGCGRTLLDFDPAAGGPGRIELGDVRLLPGQALEGVVRTANGEPVPRALVALAGSNADRGRLRPEGAAPVKGGCGELARKRADHAGRFRFPDLAPGSYRLTANSPGMVIGSTAIRVEPGVPVTRCEVGPRGDHSFVLRVLDPDGQPVPGFLVSGHARYEQFEARTGEDGRARILGLSDFDVQIFSGGSRDDLPAHRVPRVPAFRPDGGERTLRLLPAVPTPLLVLDPDGAPLPLAMVEVVDPETGTGYGYTDQRGRVTLMVPPDGAVEVLLSKTTMEIGPGGLPRTIPNPFEGRIAELAAGAQDAVLRTSRREDVGQKR